MEEKKYYYSVGSVKTDPVRIAQIKIKRSVFTCSLAYAASIEEAKAFITKISKENKTATHNCWAYIVGEKGEVYHGSDGGEPGGTAGKPMLNALHSHGMTQVAAVVTRQYGGVKLGIRGLIQAYSQAVVTALELKPLAKLVKTVIIGVKLSYGLNDTFLNQLTRFRAVIRHTDYTEAVIHEIEVENDQIKEFQKFLLEYQHQGSLRFDILVSE
ncbi:MAG: YigZ family protein [Desulfobacteraceae bacterium]|nr:YigZ family protein [Desulfobacteraceae bacterium]